MQKIRQFILVVGDIFLAFVALFLTLNIRYLGVFTKELFNQHLLAFAIIYFVWLVIFYVFGLYDLTVLRPKGELATKIAQTFSVCLVMGLTFFYLIPFFGITPKRNLLIDIGIFGLLITIWRKMFYRIFSSVYLQNVAFLGDNNLARTLAYEIKACPQVGYKQVGFLNPDFNITQALKKHQVKILIISKDITGDKRLINKLYGLIPLKISFLDLSEAYEIILQKVPIDFLNQAWFLKNISKLNREIYDKLKRMSDIVLSGLILALTSPFWVLTALLIKLEDRGPVFYRQERVGKDGKVFKIWKFRSMKPDAEKQGAQWAKDKDIRRTKTGTFIRRFHIDEFPQMLNVLKGDISLTGPRPERPEFVKNLERQIPHYHLRHLIKPGFTGWAQTRWIKYARSQEDSHEKFQYDLYYIKNRSLALDLSILLKTFQLFFTKG